MTTDHCPHCGAQVEANQPTCSVCGSSLVTAAMGGAAPSPGGPEPTSEATAPQVAAPPAQSAPPATEAAPTQAYAPYPGLYSQYPQYPQYPQYGQYPAAGQQQPGAAPAYPTYGGYTYPTYSAPTAYGYGYGWPGYYGYGYAPYMIPAPVRRAPGETYAIVISWIVTVASGISILGGLLLTALLTLAVSMAPPDLALLGGALGFTLGPILGGAFGLWYGISGIRRRPSPGFRLPSAWALLGLAALAIVGGVALWEYNFATAHGPGGAFSILPLATLAGALPALAILAYATQRLQNPSTRRHVWMSLFYGMTVAPLLAVILEGIASAIIVALFRLSGADAQAVLGNPNVSSSSSPSVLIAVFLVLSVVAPLVEEGVKPLGAVLAVRRLRTPGEMFLVGLAAGIGFDMFETIGYIGMGQADWVTIAIERLGAGLLHGVGAGMGALGWYYIINGKGVPLRWLRAIGCGAYAVLQHGIFNGFSLLDVALPSNVGDWLNQPYYIGSLPLQNADVIYLGLYLLLLGMLTFMTHRLLRAPGMPAPKPPAPMYWPYAPYGAYGYAPYAMPYAMPNAWAPQPAVAPSATGDAK